MFIQTEETPNPATLKFLPGREVLGTGSAEFLNPEDARQSPLAALLFDVPQVAGVMLGPDFVTVTKTAEADWPSLKVNVLSRLMDHFSHNRPIMLGDAPQSGHATADLGNEIVKQIIDILDQKIRPAVAQDGGDIVFSKFEEGVVYLRMKGSCAGCPSSTATLKAGIENMLRHYIPEVKEVRPAA
ncbi:MAG: NifU family protein [Alphaproteobacteria bacterium]|nr:NifU family protein [Alphaproteobacteria bacterium]NDG05059.1 NifU family protein [Alphaproteobacteria bacterium]